MRDEKWEALRKQYEDIQAPPVLKERLETMMKETNKNNRTYGYLGNIGKCAAAVVVAVAVTTNVSPAAAAYLEQIPVLGAFAELVTFRNYQDDGGNTEANIQTPHVTGMENTTLQDALNEEFDAYADALIAQYEQDVKDLGGAGYEGVECSYRVVTDTDRILAVEIDTLVTQASAEQRKNYYVVDKANDKLLQLEDLFLDGSDYIGIISKNIQSQMEEQMAADESKTYFIGEEEPSAFTSIASDQQFYINEDGSLVISFNEYEVAPGYMGAVSFTIPTDVLTLVLTNDAPLQP